MRICARSGCSSPAAAILTYDRTTQTAYLSPIDDPSTRTPGDLCERHLRRFVVPRSWQLVDRRVAAPAAEVAPAPRAAKPRVAKPRVATAHAPAKRKWAEAGPSLFEAPASDAAAPDANDAAWMPRFGPDSELE